MVKKVWKKLLKPTLKFSLEMACWSGCSINILEILKGPVFTLFGKIVYLVCVVGLVLLTNKIWSLGENKDMEQESFLSQLWDFSLSKIAIPGKPLLYYFGILFLTVAFSS